MMTREEAIEKFMAAKFCGDKYTYKTDVAFGRLSDGRTRGLVVSETVWGYHSDGKIGCGDVMVAVADFSEEPVTKKVLRDYFEGEPADFLHAKTKGKRGEPATWLIDLTDGKAYRGHVEILTDEVEL